MTKSILIQALIASLLTLSMPNAYALDKCKIVKRMKADLDEKKSDLSKIEEIHRQQVEAKEIADRLMNGDEISEIRLLAEALDEEVGNISKDQVNQGKTAAASVGAVILSTYIIKKLNRSSNGLKRKFLAQALPKDRRFARHTLNAALVLSVASTFWLAYSIKENQDKKKMLAELVNKLNSIKDLTEELIDLREEIDEREVSYNLKLEELIFEGLIEIDSDNSGKEVLNCLKAK